MESETSGVKCKRISTEEQKGESSDLGRAQRASKRVQVVGTQRCRDPQIPRNRHFLRLTISLLSRICGARSHFTLESFLGAGFQAIGTVGRS
jgi:hypothetical protein